MEAIAVREENIYIYIYYLSKKRASLDVSRRGVKKLRSVRQSGKEYFIIIICHMWSVRPSAARRRDARCFGGAPLATLNQSPATLTSPFSSPLPPRDRHPITTTRTSPRTPTAFKCARARLRPRFPCVLTAARLPTTQLSVVLLAIAAAAASVPVRSECSVLLVARP